MSAIFLSFPLYVTCLFFFFFFCPVAFKVYFFIFGSQQYDCDEPSYGAICLYSTWLSLGFLNLCIVLIKFGGKKSANQYLLKYFLCSIHSLFSFWYSKCSSIRLLDTVPRSLMLCSYFPSLFLSVFQFWSRYWLTFADPFLCFVQYANELLISDTVLFS